jgi:hypothetical protein
MQRKIAAVWLSALTMAVLMRPDNIVTGQNQVRPRRVENSRPDESASQIYPTEVRGELVIYPTAAIAFICGPQLKPNSPLNPFPWFDSTQVARGHVQGREAARVAPRVLTGVVSVAPNSRVVTGVGTRFRAEVDPRGPAPFYDGWFRIQQGNTWREVKIASVEADTQLTLVSPWRFADASQVKADTHHRDTNQARVELRSLFAGHLLRHCVGRIHQLLPHK